MEPFLALLGPILMGVGIAMAIILFCYQQEDYWNPPAGFNGPYDVMYRSTEHGEDEPPHRWHTYSTKREAHRALRFLRREPETIKAWIEDPHTRKRDAILMNERHMQRADMRRAERMERARALGRRV